jgi:PAS domain S-box-containing protein
MHILFVDDDSASRAIHATLLNSRGHTVTTAANGRQALDAARRDPPDVVVSDILMPDMDGFELCRALKQDATLLDTPFMFFSATYVEPEDQKLALNLGASRFIIKPMDAERFIETVETLPEAHRENALGAPEPEGPDTASTNRLHALRLARKLDKKIHELEAKQCSLQESEARYRALVEASPDGIAICDESGNFYFTNSAFNRITGVTDIADLISRDLLSFVVEDARDAVRGCLSAVPGQGTVAAPPLRIHRVDGSELDVNMTVVGFQFKDSDVLQIIIRDVSDRVQAEAEREALIRELHIKNDELERFNYSVSHDLKAPLITISGFLPELAASMRDGLQDRFEADLKRVSDAAAWMNTLLDELLELSRAGLMPTPMENVALSSVVDEALRIRSDVIERTSAEIIVAPDLPQVRGDQARLVQLVLNLIDNAIRFARPQAPPRIEIGCTVSDGKVVCRMRDNGKGFDPKYRDRIFELFEKIDQESPGTGVGLALVKRIAKAHGGRVSAESDGHGKGAAICFELEPARGN